MESIEENDVTPFFGKKRRLSSRAVVNLKQEGNAEAYKKKFIQYDDDISEEFLLANFIRGLETRIQTELRLIDPDTMENKIEEKLATTSGPKY